MKSGIYKIVNLINNKIYVGSSINLQKRWILHTSQLNKNKHGNLHLQAAWIKYKPENFRFEVVEYYKKSKLIEREQFYINLFSSLGIKLYNACLVAGSRMGTIQSAEARKKMSLAKIGKISLLKGRPSYKKGIPRPEEDKRKIALTRRRGIPRSEETKKKISEATKNPSEETRKRMSKARRICHKVENGKELKWCSKCNKGEGRWLGLLQFSQSKKTWDGLSIWCRNCFALYHKNQQLAQKVINVK